jgi:dTMP kinase
MPQGLLIVIEGGDGSGKQTQTAMLVRRLRQDRVPVETMSFPRYGKSFGAQIVRAYLDGQFGDPKTIDPFLAAIPYAMDRHEAAATIKKWLAEGKVVISDRYNSANVIHQGAKVAFPAQTANVDDEELAEDRLDELTKFLDRLETELFDNPQPDVVIYLHVSPQVSQALMEKQGRHKDGHEADLNYAQRVERVALFCCDYWTGWQLVECCPGGREILSPERIHELVYQKVKEAL